MRAGLEQRGTEGDKQRGQELPQVQDSVKGGGVDVSQLCFPRSLLLLVLLVSF